MWRKIIPLILFNFIVSVETFAQVNLVPNGDFEIYDTCPIILPTFNSTITYALPWFQPYTPQGSSDYLNACDTTNVAGVPLNFIGWQNARSGYGYAGIICLYDPLNASEYREYLEIELSDSLIAGNKYCVQFYVSRANDCQFAFANIGAYFSSNIVTYNNPPWGLLSYIPQIENLSSNIISDTTSWTLIYGDFIANGGEKFMTVGSFTAKNFCNYISIGNSNHNYAYYYFDDFSVIDCTNTGLLDYSLAKDLEIYPNPVKDILNIKFGSTGNSTHDCLLADLTGKIFLRKNFSSGKDIQLDLSEYPAGMYFLNVYDGKENITRKIIKE